MISDFLCRCSHRDEQLARKDSLSKTRPLLTQLLLLSKKLLGEKKRSKWHCKSKRREPQVLTKTCVLLVRKLPSGRVFPH